MGFSALHNFDLGNLNRLNPGSNILSVTSTAAGDFDKANLTRDSVKQVWRSADVVSWQEIIIEAEVESDIDTFAILGHNFTETAIVQIQANISNNFLAPPVTKTMVWNEQNMVETSSFGGEYSFYKVRILDVANPCGYVEIGRIVGGRAIIMQNNEDIVDDFSIGYKDMAKRMETEGFFRASNENVKVRTLSVKFRKLYSIIGFDENFRALRQMYLTVGITRPFLALADRNQPALCTIWGLLEDIPDESYTVNQFVDQSVKIKEVF